MEERAIIIKFGAKKWNRLRFYKNEKP